eukprot:5484097-Pyramimonas_sp.AAC.1
MPERTAVAGLKGHGGGCACCTARPAQMHRGYAECTLHSAPWTIRTRMGARWRTGEGGGGGHRPSGPEGPCSGGSPAWAP